MLDLAAIAVPAAFAGVVATGVTVAIEKLGGRLGGIIATLPSTVVPAAIGISAEASSPESFDAAMHAIPAGMLINAGFLYLWRVLPGRLPAGSLVLRLTLMSIVSLLGWGLAASAMLLVLDAAGGSPALTRGVGWGSTLALGAAGAAACVRAPPALRGSRPVGLPTLLGRGALAAAAIAAAVAIAALGGGFAAGLASVFPAIFLTTMFSLWLSQGEAVPAGAVGPMMLGSTAVSGYALIAAHSLPALGPALGSGVAWVGAVVCCTLPAWALLQRLRADR